jgi:hypothetical protein
MQMTEILQPTWHWCPIAASSSAIGQINKQLAQGLQKNPAPA